MPRAVLLLALLSLPALAAPQLKPKPPPPDLEDVRIQALKAKYEDLLRTADPALRNQIAVSRQFVKQMAEYVEEWKARGDQSGIASAVRALHEVLGDDTVRWDFYDVYVYDRDRKKVAGGK
jgi:hypothetical protein